MHNILVIIACVLLYYNIKILRWNKDACIAKCECHKRNEGNMGTHVTDVINESSELEKGD